MNINCNLVVNSVSFGHCSINILYEFYKRNIEPNLFLIANQGDLSSYNVEPEFAQYIKNCAEKAMGSYKREYPNFRLWHINQSESGQSFKNYLFTFFECDELTKFERNILNNQEKIFVSSSDSKQVFETFGVTRPIIHIPLGYDSKHFYKLDKTFYKEEVVVWCLNSKIERRKNTVKTIKSWIKKFGNDKRHILHLMIYNVHLSPEQNSQLLSQAFEGGKPFNINILPYVKNYAELNDAYNCANIVIDMSGSEGWSLPSFHMVGLGKHAVLHRAPGIKDWGNDENAVMVSPNGKIPIYDGIHFHQGAPFNQGNLLTYDDNDLMDAFDKVLERYKKNPINEAGLKLREQFTWSKTTDVILNHLN
jgi:glycosyltransferase involved in cell wall biosynthesis